MQAFEWAVLFPGQVDAVVAIASTHALHPQGVAWNAIARNAIMHDPAWQGGHYYDTGRAPDAGMGVARMVGHITYLSALALSDKFGRRLQFADDIRYTITEPEFQVESYLNYQGDKFGKSRMRECLLGHLSEPAEQICRQMLWETRRFVGLNRRTDDTTMVVVKVTK